MNIEIEEIRELFEDGELEDAIKAFIILTRGTNFYNIATPINISYRQYQKDKMAGLDLKGTLEKITQNFTDAFSYFAEENNLPGVDLRKGDEPNQDKTFDLFCSLDFTHQSDYFDSLVMGNNVFMCFIIHGQERKYGQEWLANKLINTYKKKKTIHKPIILESEPHIENLSKFVDLLSCALDIKFKNIINPADKKSKLRKALEGRIETSTQFIIVKNAYPLFHSDDFNIFCEINEYFYKELNNNEFEHKCIIIFLEEDNPEPYQKNEYCIFSRNTDALSARSYNKFRFVDLDTIAPINENVIEDWLKKCPDDFISCIRTQIKEIIGDGNPFVLIPEICKKINVDYNKFQTQWLNY